MLSTAFRVDDVLCDRFRIVRFIAHGGMGELYEASDLALGDRVALKAIRPEIASSERAHQRFLREVQLARKVTHPNICRMFDLFQHVPASGSPATFVTMELLQGETLSNRLRREGPFSIERALPLAVQLGSALSAAHAAGVVHRDFKSNNVMLLESDSRGAVVTDFGLAYSLSDDTGGASTAISKSGELFGTPDYMAPEQIQGGPITPATDIYALGIVLYEIVTGRRPFEADSPLASAIRRLKGPPQQSPRALVPRLPHAWDRTIMRCLAIDPRDRFPDAAAVVDALRTGKGAATWNSRRVVAALAAGAAALAVATALVWRGVRARSEAGAAPLAVRTADGNVAAVRPAVAVIGFRNLNGREDAQWLSTGLAEMLATELGAGETLRTIPGENVNRMKMELALAEADSYSAETLARIRQNVGADLIVSGSYVAVGEGANSTLRVDIRLQDSREGRTISVVSETGKSVEVLDIVSRAGSRLRERLGGQSALAAASVRASQPASAEVSRLYTEGLTHLRRFDALGARPLFERAIQADPRFPLAHSALARTWSFLGYDSRAREAAARAFELGSSLGRGDRLQIEGTYRELSSDWKQAIANWQTLSTLFPDEVEHMLRLAGAQIESGAPKDGLATVETFKRRFPGLTDPRLELAEASAAEALSDFKRVQTAAALAAAAAQAQGAQLLVARAKLLEGNAVLRQGDSVRSANLFEDARHIYAEVGDRAGVARALNNLAAVISDGPDTKRAAALYEEGLAIARAIGQQNQVARFLNNMAIQERRSGNLQASLKMNQESLAIRREIGDRTNMAVSLNNIGNVLLDLSDFAGASQHYEESAAMSREIGDRRGLARALYNAAEAWRLQGELARAHRVNDEALAIRRTIDDPASVASSLSGVGQIAAMEGDLATAKRSLTEALDMERRSDRRRPMAYALYHLGDVALLEGDLAGARARHQEALDIRTQLGEKGTAAESRAALAVVALEDGRASDAEALSREAAAVFAGQSAPDNEAMAHATEALALLAQGRREKAEEAARRARALVPSSKHVLARIPVGVAAARVEGATSPAAAVRALETLAAEAVKRGLVRFGFEARRAVAEIESRRPGGAGLALMEGLKKDARARGFGLYAR